MAYFSNLVAPSAPANNALSNKVDPLSSLMAPFQQGSWYKGLPSYNTGNTSTFGAGSTVPKTTTATPSGSAPLLPVKPKATTTTTAKTGILSPGYQQDPLMAKVQSATPIDPSQPSSFQVGPGSPDPTRNLPPVGQNPGGTTSAAPQTYDTLYQGAASAAQGSIPIGKSAADIAADYGARIADVGQKGATARGGYLTTGTSPVAEGNAAVLAQTTAAEQNALAAGESAALQGTGQQLTAQSQATSGLLGAAGLTPEALRYGGAGGGNLSPDTQASTLADQVLSGARTYNDAVSAMGAYGNVGTTFLNNAISAKSPGFNFSQAQALGATQGTVAPGIAASQAVLQQWSQAYKNAPWWQTTGVPAFNAIGRLFSEYTGAGGGASTSLGQTINDARTTISNALGAAYNTTPTAFTSTVNQMIPDNATPQQVQAAMETLTNLFNIRQNVYGQPGNVVPTNTNQNAPASTNSSVYSW